MPVKKLSLKTTVIAGMLVIGLLITAIGLLAFETSRSMQRASRAILTENVSSLKAAEELELALLDQKGVVGSYLLDGDEHWLALLEEKRRKFDEWFTKAKEVAFTDQERRILQRIGTLYQQYDRLRYQVIRLYEGGRSFEARQLLLHGVRGLMDELYEVCEELLFVNEQLIAESQQRSQRKLSWLQLVLWSGIATAILLGLLGGWMLSHVMTRRLMQSEKLATLGHMAGLVAHEVRNPLTAIKMRVYSLQEELAASVSSQDDVEVIRQEIERLERIVQNFLDLIKLPEPKLQPISVRELLTKALNVLKPNLNEHAITVTRADSDSDPIVRADSEQFQQVFLNIILNAIQAMPGGGAISISTDVVNPALFQKGGVNSQHERQVEISISDTGCGIPPELREKIFDPFFTTKANGIGLGLSLAQKVVELHSGSIAISSHEGPGTKVSIRLPLVLAETLAA